MTFVSDPILKVYCAMWAMSAFLVAHQAMQPYFSRALNRVETGALFVILITLHSCLLWFTDKVCLSNSCLGCASFLWPHALMTRVFMGTCIERPAPFPSTQRRKSPLCCPNAPAGSFQGGGCSFRCVVGMCVCVCVCRGGAVVDRKGSGCAGIPPVRRLTLYLVQLTDTWVLLLAVVSLVVHSIFLCGYAFVALKAFVSLAFSVHLRRKVPLRCPCPAPAPNLVPAPALTARRPLRRFDASGQR